jgi:cell division protein FtsQ
VKKTIQISLWVLLVAGLFTSLAFVKKEQDKIICKNLEINIKNDGNSFFVERADITKLLNEQGTPLVDQPYYAIKIDELEKTLNNHPAVANAEVYEAVNGDVNIDIEQRKPIIRIFNITNESYYIDETGRLMPLSDKFTEKVLIASGNILEPYSFKYNYTMDQVKQDTSLKSKTILDELYDLATFIKADTFWNAQIEQIYVNEAKDFELVPRVGDQQIIFGDASDMSEKFNKLIVFYKEGLNATDKWNTYSTINLKFKNQIVCTKK